MINSNKAIVRSPWRVFDRPRELSLKRELAAWRYRPIGQRAVLGAAARYPLLRVARRDFDLYGEGWERRHPQVDRATYADARRAYRGGTSDKLATLGRYRFALAFENARFDGYVSEKLFDCLYAGTIPVYLGARTSTATSRATRSSTSRRFDGYAGTGGAPSLADAGQQPSTISPPPAPTSPRAAFASFSAQHFAEQLLDLCPPAK